MMDSSRGRWRLCPCDSLMEACEPPRGNQKLCPLMSRPGLSFQVRADPVPTRQHPARSWSHTYDKLYHTVNQRQLGIPDMTSGYHGRMPAPITHLMLQHLHYFLRTRTWVELDPLPNSAPLEHLIGLTVHFAAKASRTWKGQEGAC